jgi:asparagine synthase (glutamine-hydrolysing)
VDLKLNLTKRNLAIVESNQGKQIVRFAMKNYLPGETVLARKKGFSAPDADWFRSETVDFLEATFLKKNARIFVFLKKRFVRTKIKRHIKGRENTRLFIWSMIALENWMKIFEPQPRPK